MKILITSGGTSEKIDQVRKISNSATGRLGSLTADAFLQLPDTEVTYICSENAAQPSDKRAGIRYIEDVQSLQDALEAELKHSRYDAVIHAMAVSDYRVKYAASADSLAEYLAGMLYPETAGSGAVKEQLTEQSKEQPKEQPIKKLTLEELTQKVYTALLSYEGEPREEKLSSEIGHLFLGLEKTPKIISMLKKLQPDMVLVGFKLLSGVTEEELLRAAETVMRKNGCDFVLANDASGIDSSRHEGILTGADGTRLYLHTKQEIAQAIVSAVTDKIRKGIEI